MYHSTLLLSTIAVLPFAHGFAFGGPEPTGVAIGAEKAVNGWTPQPTKGPSIVELRRRQSSFDDNTCGWVDASYSSYITCASGRTCAIYTASDVGMAGCCDEDTQNCGWAKSCVNYDSWTKSSCGLDCQNDNFIWKCSNSATPYCQTWTYPDDGVADYGCATYNSGVQTIYQTGIDTVESLLASVTLPTLTGSAVTGWETTSEIESTSDFSDFFSDASTSTESEEAEPTETPVGGGSTSRPQTTKKKSNVGLIAGAVVGGLVVLFVIIAALIFFCLKKRKSKQIANNQQIIAAAQANPGFQAPQHQPPMQQQHAPQMPIQSPVPQQNGYFTPPQDQKINYQSQVHEYGPQSPISNPATPAPPAYVQPYYAAPNDAPPLPTQEPGQYVPPPSGSHEVDAITAPQARPTQPNVYEMGSSK